MPEEFAHPSSGSERGRNAAHETGKGEKKTNGETRKESSQRDQKKKLEAQKLQEEAEKRREEVRKNLEKKFKDEKKIPQVAFKDAKEALEVRARIRDEKDVIIPPNQLKKYQKLLTEAGFDHKAIEKMSVGEIEVYAMEVLKQRRIAEPKDSDFNETTPSKKKAEATQFKTLMSVGVSDQEEVITPQKADRHISVEEFGEKGRGAGVGTMEAESWSDNLPPVVTSPPELARFIRQAQRISRSFRPTKAEYDQLQNLESALGNAITSRELDDTDPNVQRVIEVVADRISSLIRRQEVRGRIEPDIERPARERIDTLLNLASSGQTTGDEWNRALEGVQGNMRRVQELVEAEGVSKGYREAYYINKAIRDSLLINRDIVDGLPDEIRGELEAFTDRKEGSLARLYQKFKKDLDEKNPEERDILIGDISRDAITYFKHLVSGFGVNPEEAKQLLENMIGDDPTGIREWRAMVAIDGLENAISVHQKFEPPDDWHETPEKLANIYAFIEGLEFSVEELTATIQQAIAIVQRIPPNIPEGREMRERLIKELDAFRAFHSLRITLERNDMDPSEFLPLFRQYFDDETWIYFVARFGRDERDRNFVIPKKDEQGRYLDQNGNVTQDVNLAAREQINLLDVGFELYSEQLKQDRVKMNIVEEMTKHAIENPFDHGTLNKFQEWLGLPLTNELRAQIEELRKYFVEKTRAKINNPNDPDHQASRGLSVDEVWGRKKMIEVGGREIKFLDITAELIKNWHTKKTLQGAFGIVGKDDLADLASEFGITQDQAKKYLGKKFLDIRRGQILEQLGVRLNGLERNSGDDDNPDYRNVDLDKMLEAGFLESVDSNAYYFVWAMEWSVYDSIRIYSRDSNSKLRDDYDHLVTHQSSNLFFGRQVDQSWEFFHEQNENRGRPKENDVNRIWKQFLPGKHSWLFPQNNIATRWASFFMTPEQVKEVAKRTKRYMAEWDFDNEKQHKEFGEWMSNVVVRDMIESGEISFGLGSKKLSEAANEVKLRKFEFVDVFIDRSKHVKFTYPDVFQDYLANPTEGKFIDINDKVKTYYSTRDARQWPWMTFAFRAHWEVASKHRLRLFDDQNLSSAAAEMLVDGLVGSGNMEKEQGVKEKRKWLGFNEIQIGGALGIPVIAKVPLGETFGITPFRRARQKMEGVRRTGWDSRFLLFAAFWAGFWAGLLELVKQLPSQTFQQVQGR